MIADLKTISQIPGWHSLIFSLFVLTNVASAAEPQRLTDSGRLKFSPTFCDEGRGLVYAELTDPTMYRLQRLNLSDGMIEPLHTEANTAEFEPAWAADGQAYAFLKARGTLSVSIAVHDAKRVSIGEILPEGGFFGYRHPSLAPEKSRLAFSYGDGGTQQIYASRLDGGDRKALTSSPGLNHWPSYSHDGHQIAFGSSRDGNFEIYVMQADGANQHRVTDHPLQDLRPRFSPDGQRIVFTSHRDGNAEIYIVNSDATQLQRVTDHVERDDFATWHPDGEHIVTVSERKGRHDMYLWDIDQTP